MRAARHTPALALALALLPGALLADDSVFGIRGLGILGRPVSARSAAAGGAFGLFDAQGGLNPAALSAWRGVAGWGVGVPSRRRFESAAGDATLTSTRFPLFGFATVLGPRLVLGVTISDYLDRNWLVSRTTDTTLRGDSVTIEDEIQSAGGVSDLRLAAAWRASGRLAVGFGLHFLTGSTRLVARRRFDDPAYADFSDVSVTRFSGVGASLGAVASLRPNLTVAGTVRAGSSLRATSDRAGRAEVALPLELSGGVMYGPAPGVLLAVSASHSQWSRANADLVAAGESAARDVWSLGAGLEVASLRRGGARMPARLGYRWRQLPFLIGGEELSERAVSAGFGLNLTGGRTTLDFALERGSRSAAGSRESFTALSVGLTVRP
jgi:hypothetical protein